MQKIIILGTLLLTLIFLLFFWRCIRGRASRFATSITIAVSALFAIETASLHALDAVLYRPIGPILLIGWIWAFAAIGILLASTQIPQKAD
jgi:hypothetical protein